jgi:hypothetical protein
MIIGLVGLIDSGKGTVGDYLETRGFIKESFAKPLKDAVAIIFNWPRHLLEGNTPESRAWRDLKDEYWSRELGWTVTARAVLQKMGTEAGRNVFGEPIWTSSLINRLKPDQNYVITDVRFANEIDVLRAAGAKIIQIQRGELPNWVWAAKSYLKMCPDKTEMLFNGKSIHISEYGWVNSIMDYVMHNDSTLEQLYLNADSIVRI